MSDGAHKASHLICGMSDGAHKPSYFQKRGTARTNHDIYEMGVTALANQPNHSAVRNE